MRKDAFEFMYEQPNWMKNWMRMPQVMDHCWRETMRPRIAGAVTSAWYTGTTAEEMPTDEPAMRRPTTSMARFYDCRSAECGERMRESPRHTTDAHWITAPMTQMTPASWTVRFRPSLSPSQVVRSEPRSEPPGMAAVMPAWTAESGCPNWASQYGFCEGMSTGRAEPGMRVD
jgi:hypothetical protein